MRNAKLRHVRGHSIDLARTNDSTTWNGLAGDHGKGRVLHASYPWDLIFKTRAVPAGSGRHGRNSRPGQLGAQKNPAVGDRSGRRSSQDGPGRRLLLEV